MSIISGAILLLAFSGQIVTSLSVSNGLDIIGNQAPSSAPVAPLPVAEEPSAAPSAEPTPAPTSKPTPLSKYRVPLDDTQCEQYGGILNLDADSNQKLGFENACCHPGCSMCGSFYKCREQTIYGVFIDEETSAAACCPDTIVKSQKYCGEDGNAPCALRLPSICPGRKKKSLCKVKSACVWASIPAHTTVGVDDREVHNDSDETAEFCVDRRDFQCSMMTKRDACERESCRWTGKHQQGTCVEWSTLVECVSIMAKTPCKAAGCKWHKISGKQGICHDDN